MDVPGRCLGTCDAQWLHPHISHDVLAIHDGIMELLTECALIDLVLKLLHHITLHTHVPHVWMHHEGLQSADSPWSQSTGTRTCQCVHTNPAECANAGSNSTKAGNKVGSRTLEPSWLHAISGCLARPMKKLVSTIVVDEWFKRLAGSTCWLRYKWFKHIFCATVTEHWHTHVPMCTHQHG